MISCPCSRSSKRRIATASYRSLKNPLALKAMRPCSRSSKRRIATSIFLSAASGRHKGSASPCSRSSKRRIATLPKRPLPTRSLYQLACVLAVGPAKEGLRRSCECCDCVSHVCAFFVLAVGPAKEGLRLLGVGVHLSLVYI